MATRVIAVSAPTAAEGEPDSVDAARLHEGIEAIRVEQGLPTDFPDEVLNAAAHAALHPRLPELDLTDIPFVTLDPPDARDLDQALHLARDGEGFLVHYAIADLAAFITPGDPVDLEAHRRGETLYGADAKVPLHPTVLSEGAASLLPDQLRPALVWTIRLDAHGAEVDARVERALVRSRGRFDYAGVQAQLDAGTAEEVFVVLGEVGRLRIVQEAERGGVSLPRPEQDAVLADGRWHLAFRSMLPVESWNAQISLLTGFAAAAMMVYARVGILRTLPPPESGAVNRLRRTARGLGIDWPAEQGYADFIRALDPGDPRDAAMVVACTSLLRGAGYVGFDGEVPAQPEHAALASEYAHVTAPLRRLVDRYGLETCVALTAGDPVPSWVTKALAELPREMQESGRRSRAYQHAVLDLLEALVLADDVGTEYDAVVVELDHDNPRRGDVVLVEPAVEARAEAPAEGTAEDGHGLPLGERIRVRLVEADPERRRVRFVMTGATGAAPTR